MSTQDMELDGQRLLAMIGLKEYQLQISQEQIMNLKQENADLKKQIKSMPSVLPEEEQ
ncbi:MAG: hypothetical protein MI862_12440 [Desulfobacterales bacterium]|nr:hypothetical protein [Desulfobacterales bacterium]